MINNKNIVIFTDRFPYGHSEIFFDTELKFLSRHFETIYIFPMDCGGSTNTRPVPENVRIIKPVFYHYKTKTQLIFKGLFNFSPVLPFLSEFFKSKYWNSKKKVWNLIIHTLLTRALLSSFKKNQSVVRNSPLLYFYWGLRWSQIVPFLPKSMKAAIVVRFHGSDLYEHTNVNYIPFREKQLKRLDGAAFISEMGKKYLTNRFPFLKDKSFVARLGTHDFGINSFQRTDKIHMVSCSNVVPVKRIHLIAQCLQFLSISVKWTHIGDGPLMADMKKLIQHIPSFVDAQFAGFMNHDQLMEFYKTNSISLFINVSSSEGIPVSVLEALSFGIPVIATDVGGTSEIIDHSVGFLVSPEITPKMLAEKIELLSQSENYQGLRIAARERWEKMGREDQLYPEFIQKLLAVKT